MNDDLYLRLLQYVADESKRNVRRLSLGKALRTLVSSRLDQLGYQTNLQSEASVGISPH